MPLILENPNERLDSRRVYSGNSRELRAIFKACVAAGRIERAADFARRLIELYLDDPAAQQSICAEYIQAHVAMALESQKEESVKMLQRWFELEMRRRKIPVNAAIYALLTKASLRVLQGPKMERTVRRYIHMADNSELLVETLSVDGILSDEDLSRIARICPVDFFPTLDDNSTNSDVEIETVSDNQQSNPTVPPKVAEEIRPTEQKGLGLKTLKQSLAVFSHLTEGPASDRIFKTKAEEARFLTDVDYRRQIHLEENSVEAALNRWRAEHEKLKGIGRNSALTSAPLASLLWQWQCRLTSMIKEELTRTEESESMLWIRMTPSDKNRLQTGPFIRLISPEKLAATTILSFLTTLSLRPIVRGTRAVDAILHISASLEDENIAESIRKGRNAGLWTDLPVADRKRRLKYFLKRKTSRQPLAKMAVQPTTKEVEEDIHPRWTASLKGKVGGLLLSLLLKAAVVEVPGEISTEPNSKSENSIKYQPAFSHVNQNRMGKRVGVIMANTHLISKMEREPIGGTVAKFLPMLVKPQKWTGFNQGGFLLYPSRVMRCKGGDSIQAMYAKSASTRGDMDQMYEGLDVLSKTPWKINRPVFDVMLEAWNSGEAIANIPPENPQIEQLPKPSKSDDPLAYRIWQNASRMAENKRGGLHSQRCFHNFQLEVARAFLEEKFYFPHNLDFRGRAYPIPPYMNHMGADNCRGLLLFADGKELGTSGLTWLKVHLANLFGFDKASLRDRAEFAMNNIANIYDSATAPMAGNRWWLKAEDPWQCLAACIELKNALESPDPERFISHLPVHQDGTCNGLQHYAALGGDSWGAQHVNLEPGDAPSDVYTAVADIVREKTAADAANGNVAAQAVLPYITRRVVKQTVMTNVYGVTYDGAKAQVRKQLDQSMRGFRSESELDGYALSGYVASKIFKALASMFSGAHEIQYWLAESASRISSSITPRQIDEIRRAAAKVKEAGEATVASPNNKKKPLFSFNSSVIWTTPLKLPVVQPYRDTKSRLVHTNVQQLRIQEPYFTDPVNRRKQIQGFPPNFIHSLDASHMVLSAIKSDQAGLTFAAVHDSFWTHASDIDKMNEALRDAFIELHSQDIIGRLATELTIRYKGSVYEARIRQSSAISRKIADHRMESFRRNPNKKARNFDGLRMHEFLQEVERMRLLDSSDPEEQKRGREMVTPATIYAAMASRQDLSEPEGMASLRIGHVPATNESPQPRAKPDDMPGAGELETIELVGGEVEADDLITDGTATNNESKTDGQEPGDEHEDEDEDGDEDGDATPSTEEATPPKKPALPKGFARKFGSMNIWLPLEFPPIPKKGDFDVSRLKNSKYFFS
ncbi:MAG: DNA-directed RNA polymerase [Trizodia sp. TS-e1964]|nr:MAG: DNA-directed RNA polymerase [Trizodia sp. TS-e1964]